MSDLEKILEILDHRRVEYTITRHLNRDGYTPLLHHDKTITITLNNRTEITLDEQGKILYHNCPTHLPIINYLSTIYNEATNRYD